MLHTVADLAGFFEWPKLRYIDMGFSIWSVRSLNSRGSLMAVSKELSKYKLDF
jgi:hypothetical protein